MADTANILLAGVTYQDVPAVTLPTTDGSTATFKLGGTGTAIYAGSGAPDGSLGADGDLYFMMPTSGTVEAYPEAYTTSGSFSNSSNLGNCIGVSAQDGSSTSNTYAGGSGSTAHADYTFDLSGVPAGATIDSVVLTYKGHEENASRSTSTVRLYAGSTAKGSLSTMDGTSNAIYTIDDATFTRSELDELVMRFTVGYYGGLVAGATLTVTYSIDTPEWEATISGDGSSMRITGASGGSKLYVKSNGAWAEASQASSTTGYIAK